MSHPDQITPPDLGYRDNVLRDRFDPGPGAYANLPDRDVWTRTGAVDGILDLRAAGLTWAALAEIRSWAPLPS